MYAKSNAPKIALPRGWSENVRSAMLHVISLAQFGMAYRAPTGCCVTEGTACLCIP